MRGSGVNNGEEGIPISPNSVNSKLTSPLSLYLNHLSTSATPTFLVASCLSALLTPHLNASSTSQLSVNRATTPLPRKRRLPDDNHDLIFSTL